MVVIQPRRGVPWLPGGLRVHGIEVDDLRGRFRYVLVEEIVGGVAELQSWPWPLADDYGHLFWPDPTDVLHAVVPTQSLVEELYGPNELHRRPRSGDTFAAEVADALAQRATDPEGHGQVKDLHTLFPGAVFDISADAREAAKLAYQGATAAVAPEPTAPEANADAEPVPARRMTVGSRTP